MNALEHYIEEILSVEEYKAEWTEKYDKQFVEVELVVNCYGCKETIKTVLRQDEWEEAQKLGYIFR